MIVPSASNIKFKFPEFSSIDDPTVEFAVEEACVMCSGGDWIDASNEALAIMYLAGHLLMVSLQRAQSATGQLVASERVGELSVTYVTPPQPTATDTAVDLTLTPYGIRYLGLVRANFPAILTVNSAVGM